MLLGKDNYPKTIVKSMRLLNEYKAPTRAQRVRENQAKGVVFIQEGKTVDVKNITCYHCGTKGHYRSNCPELQVPGVDDGVQNFTINQAHAIEKGHGLDGDKCTLIQSPRHGTRHDDDSCRGCGALLNKWHIFINTCASYANTPYPEILENLRKQKMSLRGHTNSGSTMMDHAGELGNIKQVWLNEGGVASIVPLKILEKIWPVMYNAQRGV